VYLKCERGRRKEIDTMSLAPTAFTAFVLLTAALAAPSVASRADASLACNVRALAPRERERHHLIAEKLASTVTRHRELANGYEFALDLSKAPPDAAGAPFCAAEIGEWIELESRCCPFLDFGLDVHGRDRTVTLRLTGPEGVKAFLEEEIPLLRSAERQGAAARPR
jgi:hypothetical protein